MKKLLIALVAGTLFLVTPMVGFASADDSAAVHKVCPIPATAPEVALVRCP